MQFRETNFKLALKNIFLPSKKNEVVLEPHLGLGDSLLCVGLVRTIAAREPQTKFYYTCLHSAYKTVSWMFQDLNNVYVVPIHNGREARQLSGFLNATYRPIGVEGITAEDFDAFFYQQHDVPFDVRWSMAQVAAGPNSDALYEKLDPAHEPYILVCCNDSGPHRYELAIDNPHNKKIIEVHPATNNLYDWTKLALEADEIHTVDTGFIHFIESLFYQRPAKPFFYHLASQARNNTKKTTRFTLRLPWKVVSYGA
jgi:hypothetical protein